MLEIIAAIGASLALIIGAIAKLRHPNLPLLPQFIYLFTSDKADINRRARWLLRKAARRRRP